MSSAEACAVYEGGYLELYKSYFNYLWDIIPNKYLKYTPSAESKDSIGSCFDGVDNNFNGKIDIEDEKCQ